jgi:hypothetical protein
MNRVFLLLVGIAIGVGASLWLAQERTQPNGGDGGSVSSGAAGDDDDDDDIPARVRRIDGASRVVLTPDEMVAAGIEIAPARVARAMREERAYGRVADPGSLLSLWRDLRAAQAAADAQRGIARAVDARLERLRGFSARGEISVSKELADLEVEQRRMSDHVAERTARVEALRTNLRSTWGAALSALALDEPARLAALEAGEAQLIEFATAGAAPGGTVFAAPGDERQAAQPVTVLGPAATVLGGGQSASYFGLAQSPTLRVGMRLNVWVPQGDAAVEGVLLPTSALVWHAGRTWFYVVAAPGGFERRPVGAALPQADGVLLPAQPPPGEGIVVRGAQALLAEEFRAWIPEEDDD